MLDASLLSYFHSLTDFSIARWLSLSEGLGPDAGIVAAATYCSGFELSHFQTLLAPADWLVSPWSPAHIASQFCQSGTWNPPGSALSLVNLLKFGETSRAIAPFVLGADNKYPRYDTDQTPHELEEAVASLLFFFGARDGFNPEQEKRLFEFLKREDTPLLPRFWASFAAILRYPHLHEKIAVLTPLIDGDAVRATAAAALAAAIEAGPLKPEEAQFFYDIHAEGPLETRLARALRLAAFVPGTCPMIDVFAPWSKQERQAEKVKEAIDQAIASGASFTPAAYAEKARHAHVVKTEADKRERAVKERMEPRGWNEAMVAEALANGPGIPVLGYPYGPALLRFHPLSGLPIVASAETNEIIHLGRADYVYNIDKEAYQALPEDARPPLPSWRETKPSAPDLETIYVRLKEEWIDVWRPIEGRWIERNIYVLMPREIPQDEAQEFWIGHHAECVIHRFGPIIGQTATKLVQQRW